MADLMDGRQPCVHCGTPNPAQWTVCGKCGRNPWVVEQAVPPVDLADAEDTATAVSSTVGMSYVVTLPDFSELVVRPGERLTIGRETDVSAIDGALEPYLDVSRIHLAFESTPSGLIAMDVDSTYGTWLEQERLEPHVSVAVVSGQRLRLGKNCYLKVTQHGD